MLVVSELGGDDSRIMTGMTDMTGDIRGFRPPENGSISCVPS